MLDTLEKDPLLLILRRLSVHDLGVLAQVCRKLKGSVYNCATWYERVAETAPDFTNIQKLGIGSIDSRFRFRIFSKHTKMFAANHPPFSLDLYNLLEHVKAPWELFAMLGDWENLKRELDKFDSMPTSQFDIDLYTPFSFSIMGNNDKQLPKLCEYYSVTIGPEMADIAKLTSLAAQYGRLDTLERFHNAGVNLNFPEDNRPIVYAASYNHVDVLKQMIAWGYDASVRDANGFTVLHSLALFG
ncbi:MAG: hypothetical protein M3R00_07215, partial [Pseudomonadota bacterium]|nr:hypothetical protein [Pseudomonadota bacterium]